VVLDIVGFGGRRRTIETRADCAWFMFVSSMGSNKGCGIVVNDILTGMRG